MTAATIRDTHNVETQKQRYSRELAAYTLRQWDTARQAMEDVEEDRHKSSSSRSSSGGNSTRSSRTPQGIQSIDYASRLRNGVRAEGRTVAAGNA